MNQTMWTDKKILIFSCVTAATTVIAGILHILMVPDSLSYDLKIATLFLIGGMLQIFWAVPVIKRWGKIWQIIGIVGTVVFFALWYANMLNLIPMDEIPMDEMPPEIGLEIGGILVPPIEIFQIAFIGLYIVLAKISRSK